MELEEDGQDQPGDRAGGWTGGQERAWSSGSDSHSSSPYRGPPARPRWRENRGYKTGPSAPSASSSYHPPALPSLMELPVGAGKVEHHGMAGLNEAQKKKLPSWIRAGLEKMEKDKLKREQEDERRKRFEERKRQERLEQAEEL